MSTKSRINSTKLTPKITRRTKAKIDSRPSVSVAEGKSSFSTPPSSSPAAVITNNAVTSPESPSALREQWLADQQAIMDTIEEKILLKLSDFQSSVPEASASEKHSNFVSSCASNLDAESVNMIVQLVSADIKKELNVLTNQWSIKLSDYENKIKLLNSELLDLKTKIDNLEQYGRRPCLIVHGIMEKTKENCLQTSKDFLRHFFKISVNNGDIIAAHRLNQKHESDRPRPLIIKFVNMHLRDLVFGQKRVLKGTNIIIRENLTAVRNEAYGNLRRLGIICWTNLGNIFALDLNNQKVKINLNDIKNLNVESFKKYN